MKLNTNLCNLFRDNLLLVLTLSGVFVGAAFGFLLREFHLSDDSILLLSYPGEIFMRILKLIILPLIISSLIAGTASLNAKLNGKIALRTITYFFLTSLLNSILGIALALIIHPGDEESKFQTGFEVPTRSVSVLDSFLDVGRNIFPDNIFQAFFQQTHTVYVSTSPLVPNITVNNSFSDTQENENISTIFIKKLKYRDGTNNIGIIGFCLLFGTVLGTLDTRSATVVIDLFKVIFDVVMKIMSGVMWLTPLGVCSIICGKVISVSNVAVIVAQLGWFVITVIIGVLFYQLVILQIIYFIFIRRNPFEFYWGLSSALLTAFATASTAAALPVTFRCLDEKLHIDQRISKFILPIGCSINMDGTALFLSSATVFIAQMNGIELEIGSLITVCLVSTAGSMSSASVPSAALVLMLMVLSSIGCPTEDVSLLFAIDWLVDRCRTTNNMLGDCYAAAVVEHLSKDELSSDQLPIKENELTPCKLPDESVIINIPTYCNCNDQHKM